MQGHGQNRLEMDFLADVWVTCETCEGARFNRETLEVRFKGKSITDVLDMGSRRRSSFFANVPKIGEAPDAARRRPRLPEARPAAPTLSGGEAQRVKLVEGAVEGRDRARRSTSSTSRPPASTSTTSRSCSRCSTAVDAGNTVLVIEHNLDVIKTADWVIDLGPEGGEAGGEVIATARRSRSPTARLVHRPLPRELLPVKAAVAAA